MLRKTNQIYGIINLLFYEWEIFMFVERPVQENNYTLFASLLALPVKRGKKI